MSRVTSVIVSQPGRSGGRSLLAFPSAAEPQGSGDHTTGLHAGSTMSRSPSSTRGGKRALGHRPWHQAGRSATQRCARDRTKRPGSGVFDAARRPGAELEPVLVDRFTTHVALPVGAVGQLGLGAQHGVEGGVERPVSYTHLRAHETPEHLVCRLLLEKKKTSSTAVMT